MIAIAALVEAAALLVVVTSFSTLLRGLARQHGRERDLLINQLLHAAGKPWQPSPAQDDRSMDDALRAALERERTFTATPEHEPVQ